MENKIEKLMDEEGWVDLTKMNRCKDVKEGEPCLPSSEEE